MGNFYGANLGFGNYEVLTIQRFDKKLRAEESALMASKWFDYRRLHPLQATYYFVHCYTRAYRDFFRQAIDSDKASFVRPFKERDFLEAREAKTVWRLRQLCDRLGVRYDFFLMTAMTRHYRMMTSEGKVYPPRVAHMLSNEDLVAEVMIAWQDWLDASFQVARDPFYRITSFSGDAHQRAHEDHVVRQIKARRVRRFTLSAALYEFDVLRIERAIQEFGGGVVEDALSEVKISQE